MYLPFGDNEQEEPETYEPSGQRVVPRPPDT